MPRKPILSVLFTTIFPSLHSTELDSFRSLKQHFEEYVGVAMGFTNLQLMEYRNVD